MSLRPIEPNIYLDDATGFYIIRKFKKGRKPLWHSTKTKSIRTARVLRDAAIAHWLNNERPRGTRRFFSDLFDEVILIKGTKEWRTERSAELAIRRHLRPWFESRCPFVDEFNESTWEKYILAQREKSPNRRLKHDREILVFTLNLARKKGFTQRVFTLRKPDPKREIGKYFEDQEIEALLRAASVDLRFQILVAVKMGMRLSEILHLSWDRIDLKRGMVVLYAEHTKTKSKRTVPIHRDLMGEFAARFEDRKSIFVFPKPYDRNRPQSSNKTAWKAAKRRSGVRGRFHDLRHRAITDMLAGGISETDTSKITGASPPVIARIYHHLRTDVIDRVRDLNCGKFVVESRDVKSEGEK